MKKDYQWIETQRKMLINTWKNKEYSFSCKFNFEGLIGILTSKNIPQANVGGNTGREERAQEINQDKC